MNNRAIVKYLSDGALLEVLGKHSGARQVWLRQGEDGTPIYTFVKHEGGVGGMPVPRAALHGKKVLASSEPEVVALLRGFGLTEAEAAEVIGAVGTAPWDQAR